MAPALTLSAYMHSHEILGAQWNKPCSPPVDVDADPLRNETNRALVLEQLRRKPKMLKGKNVLKKCNEDFQGIFFLKKAEVPKLYPKSWLDSFKGTSLHDR
ncbi:hypothetical protein RRG08_028296 [Elysia crispata]|uniref:Uncharacterized protein n=1 Tax=Elysia crispata TaxID=231223 RepID=A0AAE1AWR0_9GAST|nr:hypothetical protein RRG08_028296 [Elysia crispata]